MTSTQGRRPDGPGWYWYRGRVRDAIDFYERTYDIQDDVDQPVWVQNDYDVYIPGWQKADGWKYLSDYATPSDMPGDFVPLTKPVAAPTWSQEPPTEPGDYRMGYYVSGDWYRCIATVNAGMYVRFSLFTGLFSSPETCPVEHATDRVRGPVWWVRLPDAPAKPQPPGEVGP